MITLLDIDPTMIAIGVAAGLLVGAVVTYLIVSKKKATNVREAELEAKRIKDDAERSAREAELKAKDVLREAEAEARNAADKQRQKLEAEFQKQKNEMREQEKRIEKREESIVSKFELLDKKASTLEERQQQIEKLKEAAEKANLEISSLLEQEKKKLLELANISQEEATRRLLDQLDRQLTGEKQQRIEKVEKAITEHADEKAKWVISQAICRLASEYTGETTTSSLALPKDEVKGRIIGREGRNIRSFERITGVDVIVDDTPGTIVLSCFDSVRREVARRTMERLIEDGRIHPARIEEVFSISEKDVEKEVIEAGKRIQFEANVLNIDPRAQRLLGRMKYRSSYGQNVYKHTVEVAQIMGMMAAELRLDEKLARRCGLMHDIGKSIDHEVEGGHPHVGGEFLKKIGELPEVIEAAAGHHDNVLKHTFPYTSLAAAADAISASRPGARRESLDRYVQRLQSLEAIATSFSGVQAAFAIQAGREVRVFVDHVKVDDATAAVIARDMAMKIEDELTYPGEIRVTVLRETRCTEYAR
ncbi:MAG: ribonuclease Y [Planctomycetes bacterium]|nr:ribonuclease Y [Planctomycetota bacterium]NUQ33931.1 ribonuclease Y [Planctomycetaceae bacterium]